MHYNFGHFGRVMVHPVGRLHSVPFHVQSYCNSHKTYQLAVDEMTLPAPSCLKNFGQRRTLQNHTKWVFNIKEEQP